MFQSRSIKNRFKVKSSLNVVNSKLKKVKKKALDWSVDVFSTKVLIEDTIFTFPTGDGTAIFSCHPSHAKV